MDLSQLCLEYSVNELMLATGNLDERHKLGSGAYGSVYKGTMKDGTEVAIKVIDVLTDSGFEEEVRVLSRFRHPNLVILMGFARTGTRRFLIYELLSGGDVCKRLKAADETPFPWDQRVSILLDAACGLSHMHNSAPKAFHRDIKAANILTDRSGTAKMADFGLACVSTGPSFRVKQAAGTVGYACPYYIQRGVVTEASEVYSFGTVMLELLCNAPPACAGNTPGEILYLVNHIRGDISRLRGMIDNRAGWPAEVLSRMCDLALSCVSLQETARPNFVFIVRTLRSILQTGRKQNETQQLATRPPIGSISQDSPATLSSSTSSGSSPTLCLAVETPGNTNTVFPISNFGRRLLEGLGISDAHRTTVSREHLKLQQLDLKTIGISNIGVNPVIITQGINGLSGSSGSSHGGAVAFLSKGEQARVSLGGKISFFAGGETPICPFLVLRLAESESSSSLSAGSQNPNLIAQISTALPSPLSFTPAPSLVSSEPPLTPKNQQIQGVLEIVSVQGRPFDGPRLAFCLSLAFGGLFQSKILSELLGDAACEVPRRAFRIFFDEASTRPSHGHATLKAQSEITVARFNALDDFVSHSLEAGDSIDLFHEDFVKVGDVLVFRFLLSSAKVQSSASFRAMRLSVAQEQQFSENRVLKATPPLPSVVAFPL